MPWLFPLIVSCPRCVRCAVSESNTAASAYVYAFLIIGAFFAVNLFVGVVIDKFNRMKGEFEGSAFQTKEQKQWSDLQRLLFAIKPRLHVKEPHNPVLRVMFKLARHPWLEGFIMLCIVLNTLTMMMEHWHQSPEYVHDRPQSVVSLNCGLGSVT